MSLAVKPLLWPLGAWLLAARSFLTPRGLVAVVAVVLVLASWAAIGFAGLVEYEGLLRRLSDVMDEWGYTVYALALDLGAGNTLAKGLWLAARARVVAASFVVARRGDERRAFVLGIAAVIACSPIVWLHYFALLLVAVAVAQPTLGVAWLAPFLMFGAEEVTNGVDAPERADACLGGADRRGRSLRRPERAAARAVRAGEAGRYEGARRSTVMRSSW